MTYPFKFQRGFKLRESKNSVSEISQRNKNLSSSILSNGTNQSIFRNNSAFLFGTFLLFSLLIYILVLCFIMFFKQERCCGVVGSGGRGSRRTPDRYIQRVRFSRVANRGFNRPSSPLVIMNREQEIPVVVVTSPKRDNRAMVMDSRISVVPAATQKLNVPKGIYRSKRRLRREHRSDIYMNRFRERNNEEQHYPNSI